MTAQKYLSYTYLIGWSYLDQWYYGVRTTQNRKIEFDVIIYYPTSSNYVKGMIKEHGNPDVIHIDKTFKLKEEAKAYEYKVLQEHQVRKNNWWINKNDLFAPPIMKGKDNFMFGKKGKDSPNYGNKHTIIEKEKMSLAKIGKNNPMFGKKGKDSPNYGKKATLETKKKQSKSQKGKIITKETREKMSLSHMGNKHTNDTIQKISLSNTGKTISTKDRNRLLYYSNSKKKKVIINNTIYESITEAAEKNNVTRQTIQYWIKKGKAKIIKKSP